MTSGYAATTARSIALRAGAATGSFYQYFKDKDEILREIWTTRLAAVHADAAQILQLEPVGQEASLQQSRRRLSQVVQLLIDLHADAPKLHAVVTEREQADPLLHAVSCEARARLIHKLAARLERWGCQGDLTARAFIIHATVEGAVHAHVLGQPVVSDRRFKRDLVASLEALAQRSP